MTLDYQRRWTALPDVARDGDGTIEAGDEAGVPAVMITVGAAGSRIKKSSRIL